MARCSCYKEKIPVVYRKGVSMEKVSTTPQTIASGAPALLQLELSPLEATGFGVLGDRAPYATTSGVESLICAHSMIATG